MDGRGGGKGIACFNALCHGERRDWLARVAVVKLNASDGAAMGAHEHRSACTALGHRCVNTGTAEAGQGRSSRIQHCTLVKGGHLHSHPPALCPPHPHHSHLSVCLSVCLSLPQGSSIWALTTIEPRKINHLSTRETMKRRQCTRLVHGLKWCGWGSLGFFFFFFFFFFFWCRLFLWRWSGICANSLAQRGARGEGSCVGAIEWQMGGRKRRVGHKPITASERRTQNEMSPASSARATMAWGFASVVR